MSINIYFNKRKIRYDELNELFYRKLTSNKKPISVYIDLNSILNELYRPDIFETISLGRSSLTISSQIMNLVAHYRHYFYSRHNISTIFYLTYSKDRATYPLTVQPSYKEDYYKRLNSEIPEVVPLNTNLNKNLNIVKLLCEYIPDMYYIEGNDFEPSALPYYLIKTDTDNNQLNLIVTENNIAYQYLAIPGTYVLDIKKRKLVTPNNVYETLLGKGKTSMVSLELLTLLFAIIGKKSYNINNVKGYAKNKAIKLIEDSIKQGIIINKKYKDISEVTSNMLTNGLLKTQEQAELIISNFNVLDYELLNLHLTNKHQHLIDDSFIDRNDNNTLKRLNDTYFNREPLMLIELTEGC